MNLKTVFNWLAEKDDLPVTLGLLTRKTLLRGTKLENKKLTADLNLTRGGRIVERGVTLSSCFAAAASVSFMSLMASTPFFTIPLMPYIFTALVIVGAGKALGLGAAKVADVVTKKINNVL